MGISIRTMCSTLGPQQPMKNEGFTPQTMGEITPKNEGNRGFPWYSQFRYKNLSPQSLKIRCVMEQPSLVCDLELLGGSSPETRLEEIRKEGPFKKIIT